MNARIREANRQFRLEQARAHQAAEQGRSFREIGLSREYFCPFQLRKFDDTWTIEQSKRAIRELIAEARDLNPAGITLFPISQGLDFGRVFHGAFSAYGSLIFTIYHGETRPAARHDEFEVKRLRKIAKGLGVEGKLIVLEPLTLTEQEIRDRINTYAVPHWQRCNLEDL